MSYYANADEVYRIGVEIEVNGRAFYAAAAQKVEDPAVRQLCRELEKWEGQHVELFEALRRELPEEARGGAVFDPDGELLGYVKAAADNHVFLKGTPPAEHLAACRDPAGVLDLAIAFERDSVVFYTAMKKLVETSQGRERLDALIEEEVRHISILEQERKKLGR